MTVLNTAQIIFLVTFVLFVSVIGALAMWFDEDTTDVFEEDDE